MKTGIYKIEIGEYFYIGQSSNLRKRENDHSSYLRRGAHVNAKLQNVYDKYTDFNFKVLVYAEPHMLDALEQGLIDYHYSDKHCMNLSKDVGCVMRGRTHTEATRKKLSNFNKGKVLSKEHVKKMVESRTGLKRTQEQCENMSSPIIYTFVHKGGIKETCTQSALRLKYAIPSPCLSRLVNGVRKSAKGWRLA